MGRLFLSESIRDSLYKVQSPPIIVHAVSTIFCINFGAYSRMKEFGNNIVCSRGLLFCNGTTI